MDLSNITVLTAISGDRDPLREDTVQGKAKHIAYLDKVQQSDIWTVKPAYTNFVSPRRNSRIYKMLSHLYCDTEYSIWLDANLSLTVPPEKIIEEFLDGYDIAVFKHPERNCLYDEAKICAVHNLDNPETIIEQVVKYEKSGFPKNLGLSENNCIIRRHTNKIVQFNNMWWAEYCRHSCRDQISFMYIADKLGLRVNFIEPSARAGHKYFSFNNHKTIRTNG